MIASLSARDALFVAAYMKTRDAAVACRDSGINPRKAASMMSNPDIKAAIAAAEASGEAPEVQKDVSLHSLIRAAQEAYDLAQREGNASAMVSAVQLLAKLTGRSDGDAPELVPQADPIEPMEPRDLATRFLFCMYPDQPALQAFELLIKAIEAGETLVSIADPKLAAALGAVRFGPGHSDQPIKEQ